MGLTNIHAKLLIVALLFPVLVWGQVNVTTIPGKLKIKVVPHTPAVGDSMLVVDISGNVKKDTIPSGGGGSANGVNGLNGTGNIGLGGTLTGNTTLNLGGFNFILNQTSGNVQQWKVSGVQVASMSSAGQLFASGVSNNLTGNNAQLSTSSTGLYLNRNIADSHSVMNVQNLNALSTGDIVHFNGASNGAWMSIGYNGFFNKGSYGTASGGFSRGSLFMDVLQPTANNDLLVGLDVRPVFGTSIINGLNTLVGGSGYGTATYNVLLTGGTGSGASATLTATAGAITGVSILNAGVNYTVGDVLGATVTDIQGNVIGTGFSITVASVTSYMGVQGYALRTYGLDQYDQDYSSTYTANSKTSKSYVDGRVISNSYSLFGSATTTFTVTIGTTMPNNTYKVQVTPTNALASTSGFYVTNQTTTTFDVVYPAGLTGTVSFAWSVMR